MPSRSSSVRSRRGYEADRFRTPEVFQPLAGGKASPRATPPEPIGRRPDPGGVAHAPEPTNCAGTASGVPDGSRIDRGYR
jgi:hypothetical protein